MKANITRWTNPILGEETNALYTELYGDKGKAFLDVLESSPYANSARTERSFRASGVTVPLETA